MELVYLERRIPKIVLDLYDYRSKMYSDSKKADDLPVFDTVRDRTEYIFRWLYDTQGYSEFIKTAVKLKRIQGLEQEDFNISKGMIAEIVLLCSIEEWIKQSGSSDWNLYREFYVPHRNGNGVTEIDIVLYSTYTIVVWEVKSYSGKKTITKECTINTSREHDLFYQNGLHIESLMKQIEPLCLSKIGAVKSVYFNFSLGEVNDDRTPKNKKLIPVIDENNIFTFLEAMRTSCIASKWDKGLDNKMSEIRNMGITREQHMSQFKNTSS